MKHTNFNDEVEVHTCGREITDEEIAHAKEIKLPIAYSNFCGGQITSEG